ncbi:alkaline phosphatase D family protein [Thalassoglobus sp. JC818]|uniref:alkaline phosphatase D family protein n=1 Tax=Thalassoglobus sp. JC818 TaxID=3232136 RepID=UPI0034593104
MRVRAQLSVIALMTFWMCGGVVWGESAESPQLGNGTRNGWADQSSIVIWTRTTRNAGMAAEGPEFVKVSAKLEREIQESGEEERYVTDQLAEGASLDEMIGACPGAAGEVRLSYHAANDSDHVVTTEWVETKGDSDFTTQWKLEELKPGTKYLTKLEARPVGGGDVTATLNGSFETAPPAEENANVKFCVTTCHDFLRRDDGTIGHKIYPSMTQIDPNFTVHAGDIEYYDKPQPWAWTKELMRFKWGRIFSMPRNREYYSTHTTYFIKDDHDTLKNDTWPGQVYGNVTFEEGVQLFNEEQFPSRSPRYATVHWGSDVQIWILEGRDFRSPNNMPDGPEKSILGAEQKAWLKQTLHDSSAAFKLVFSPTPIVGPDRPNKKDNHANTTFTTEGIELRDFFSSIEGVIVFCGDRHWQYASVDDETGLWEFGCGPGSETHELGWKDGDVRPNHKFLRVAGGFLSGEVVQVDEKPQLTIRHYTVDGEPLSEFQFPVEASTEAELQ